MSLVLTGTALQLEKPARKKRRLEFTKCDYCRRDKQKCLPIEREFPAKCARCIQKGFSCSEGHRAKKEVLLEPVDRGISSELVITANRSRNELKDDNRNWLLIISYHKNMTMAMNCLHRILKETNDLFSRVRKNVKDDADVEDDTNVEDDADCWTSISQRGSDFEKFHGVFNKLSLAAQATLESMVISKKPEDLRAAFSTLRFQVLWNKTQNADKECIHCLCPVDAQSILEESNELEDPATAFFMRLAVIDHYRSHRLFWFDFSDRLRELHADVQSKCKTLLKHLDLYDAMPSISQKHALYYPEKVALRWAFTGDVVVNYQLDCLGRNHLHHIIEKGIDWYSFRRVCQATQDQETFKPHQDSFNEPDIFGRTPLHAACHKMSLDTVETLLNFGADVGRMTLFGSRPLHYAAARGSNEICKGLLATHKINTNALDKHGRTALAYAIRNEHMDVVKLLLSGNLENHADPNVYGTGCRPPLMDAILQGNQKILRHLLDAGADPGTEYGGYSTFHFATIEGNLRMMALLAEKIPDHLLDMRNNASGYTPLMTAICNGFTEGVSLICGFTGVDLNARDKEGCTPLMLAARRGQHEVVEELLKHNVYASAVDSRGRTAAYWARRRGYLSMADLIEFYEKVEDATNIVTVSEGVEIDGI